MMKEKVENIREFVAFLPGLRLNFTTLSSEINLSPFGSSLYNHPLTEDYKSFEVSYFISEYLNTTGFSSVLSGESFPGAEIPYTWTILQKEKEVAIQVVFDDDPQLKAVFGVVDFSKNTIAVTLVLKEDNTSVSIDPLFQPFGSVLMVVLAHYQDDVLIHASGVLEKGTGRLFTAVSGTGKSTMAGIWENEGATVINDDRLWLRRIDGQWCMFNTPMPYYAQMPLMASLNEIYLIRQSLENEITKLSGINAAMRFMANGIQHFYDKEMTGRHLDRILDIASHTPIYDCGFKPTSEIVDKIRRIKE